MIDLLPAERAAGLAAGPESMIEICREHFKNVKRWRGGTMALRWCAAGMLEADHQLRRVNGHSTCRNYAPHWKRTSPRMSVP